MGWTPQPTDVRAPWGRYEFCLLTLDSGMLGGPEINVIYRLAGDSAWSSVGPSDGNVYMSEAGFGPDVAAAGGFRAWWAPIMGEINRRLAAKCYEIDAAKTPLATDGSAAADPATWPQMRAWLSSLAWSGNAPQPGPQPIPAALFPLYGARAFFAGLGFDCGIEADGRPACRVNIPNVGWKKFTLE